MSTEDAVKLIREYANAAINHYCAVNEASRRTPEIAASQEEKAARKLFKALTDHNGCDHDQGDREVKSHSIIVLRVAVDGSKPITGATNSGIESV